MPYLPIEDYGVIGDLHTTALVGKDGSIDFWCYPRFDSPTVFGAILDQARGGSFSLAPKPDGVRHKQMYFPDTNVLLTRFLSPEGVVELTDFMPIAGPESGHRLVRRVEAIRGSMRMRMSCRPAFDYGREAHHTQPIEHGVRFETPTLTLQLTSSVPLSVNGPAAEAEFTLPQGHCATFVLGSTESEDDRRHPSAAEVETAFRETVRYWHDWIHRCNYRGRWREMVQRSALALKLLTYAPTGAIVAAATTSLPESIGGSRNWDYRYTWIRDASFTLYALMRIGFMDEAQAFMGWLQARLHDLGPDASLQVMYAVDGSRELEEKTLDHLEGYRASRPVRVGNGAFTQTQLDVYGELIDAVYLFNKYGTPISYDDWKQIRRVLNHVCDVWRQPDDGIWEIRGGPRHFVYSKLMCWVAIERGLRLADKRAFPADRERWMRTRDEIYEDVMERGWSEKLQAFVQAYDSDSLDASLLIMPLVFFTSPEDPRFVSTVEAIRRELTSGSLVYRYSHEEAPDGLDGGEGTFSMCSFWLVEALTRAGRVEEARLMFEKMLSYANHLGLFSEQIGPSGEAVGNFPQALTHLALITAAINLNRALGGRGEGERPDEFSAP